MNISWIIFILVLIIYFQILLYNKWGLSKISYHRSFDKSYVFAKQEVVMVDQVSNKKLLPLPWVRLEAKINRNLQLHQMEDEVSEDSEFHRTLFTLLPYQKVTRKHYLTCMKRGVYPLTSVALTVGDLFGFQEIFHLYQTNATITVYPELLSFEEIPLPAHRFLGDQTVKRWIMEDPFLTVGTRDYQSTDPAHRINWKASARTNQMQVNVHDYTADHDIIILFNADQSDDIWLPIENEALFEQALSYAATITHYLLENGERVGFGTNAVLEDDKSEKNPPFVQIEADAGNGHFYHVLDRMANLTYQRSRNFHYLLDLYQEEKNRKQDYLIITKYVNERMEKEIEEIKKNGNTVEILTMGHLEEELA